MAVPGKTFEVVAHLNGQKDTLQKKKSYLIRFPKPPRRPPNPFMIYVMAHFRYRRRRMQTRNPREIIAALARSWRQMKKAHRDLYKKKAAPGKEKYAKELAVWKQQFHKGQIPKIRRRRKNPVEPKRTRNAYIFFQQRMLPKFRESILYRRYQHRDLVKVIGAAWQRLPHLKRQPYYALSSADGRRYREEMQRYNAERVIAVKQIAVEKKMQRLHYLEQKRRCEKLGVPYFDDVCDFKVTVSTA